MKYLTLRYKLYKVHKDIMGRIAGVPNKITSEVKEKLQLLIDELIESLEINKLDTNQRIKMLQIALQYTLPRLQSMVIRDEVEVDVEDDQIVTIEFLTAWGPPHPILEKINEKFGDKINYCRWFYRDEADMFCGYLDVDVGMNDE